MQNVYLKLTWNGETQIVNISDLFEIYSEGYCGGFLYRELLIRFYFKFKIVRRKKDFG